MRGITRAIELFDDPLLGLRAGMELGEEVLDVVEHAACATANLGAATEVVARYTHIMNEGLLMSLSVEGDLAYTSFSWTVPHPPAANDIAVACALAFSKRTCLSYEPPMEVRMQHERPAYAAAYESFFEAPVSFGAPANLIVMRKERLQIPMRTSNAPLAEAFQRKMQALEHSRKARGDAHELTARVRQSLLVQLATGSVRMSDTARRLNMGVATLRRKLEDEGSSFAVILEELQREASQRYLSAPQPTVSEVAFLLGFSDVRSFARAFRRWTGSSPTEFRQKQRADERASPTR
jgi:AraC-like DNA-binding protein